MGKHPSSANSPDPLNRVLFGLRNRHLFVLDLLIFCAAPLAAVWLRTDGVEGHNGFFYLVQYADALAFYTLVAIVLRWLVFIPFGLYARYWRYASVDELGQITLAVSTATLLIVLTFFGVLRPFVFGTAGLNRGDLPRTLPFLDGVLVLIAVGGLRFSVRFLERVRQRSRNRPAQTTRVIIIGAGDAGAMIAREMQANPQMGLEPVAFLDDDLRKRGAVIHGMKVVGDRHNLRDAVSTYQIGQAIIAMPTAPGKAIRELIRLCHEANVPVKTVPGMFELLDGSVTVNQLRDVDISDLLRREAVMTDLTAVTRLLAGKRVLVTGAGGSIGSELCRQIARGKPAALVLLGHGENSLFGIGNELRQSRPNLALQSIVADIRDADRMWAVFKRYRPQIVFHAAAHKHVPLMEDNLEDAITNNIQGTRVLIRCAEEFQTERFVLISSDKAVRPTSVMGTTKRVAELLIQEAALRTDDCFVAVRFGNVLGSRGSVVPYFKQQIAQGGPVTVTHPEVRRYFMTIPEAVQLVLQAATLGGCGDIYVLDMGKPIKIVDLARDLIRLSGLEEGRDIDIAFTGLRPGEKMHEELFFTGESSERTSCDKILITRNNPEQAKALMEQFTSLHAGIDALIAAARSGDTVESRRLLAGIVPEWRYYESGQAAASSLSQASILASATPSPIIRPAKA